MTDKEPRTPQLDPKYLAGEKPIKNDALRAPNLIPEELPSPKEPKTSPDVPQLKFPKAKK